MKTITVNVPDNLEWDENEYTFKPKIEVDEIFKKLKNISNIDDAYLLCRGLEGKCFKRIEEGRTGYIKIHKIRINGSGYIFAETNRVNEDIIGGRGTFNWEERCVFTYRKDSEYTLWHMNYDCSGHYKGLEEITDIEFKTAVMSVFEEYYKNEIDN